jgi:hypothetical protein
MAGLVVKVLLEDGAQVEAGQPVMVMEAMKMEVWINYLAGYFLKFWPNSMNAKISLLFSACCESASCGICGGPEGYCWPTSF